MWSQIAAVGSLLMVARPVVASYIPDSPDSSQPTQVAIASDHLIGISPRVTDSPLLDPASLHGRADAFGRNSDTCGFYSDGFPLRCYTSTATCIFGASFGGCCNTGTTCSSVYTACIGYSDVLKGSCNPTLVTDPKVACCADRTAPNCVLHTLQLSSSQIGIWGCATTFTGELILPTNAFGAGSSTTTSSKARSSSSSSASSTSSSGSASATPSDSSNANKGGSNSNGSTGDSNNNNNNNNSSGGKSNTGAIVGGVVGGVGGIALIGAAIFLLMRHRKKNADASPATAVAQPMLQHQQQSPPPPGHGVPYGYPPQGSPVYDPNMAYQHQQGSPQPYGLNAQVPYDPHHPQTSPQPYPPSSQSPYDPHHSQQQSSWGQPSTATTSPAPIGHSPSPGQGPAVELSDSRPIGSHENRAELG